MSKVYSTQELIEILAQERRSCINGQRLNLAASVSGNPVIDRFLKPEGIQKFSAYNDFKAAVHSYQRQHQVSGIIWRELTMKGKTLRYPAIDEQLAALESDLKIIKAAKADLFEFWHRGIQGMDLYLSINFGKDYQKIMPNDVKEVAQKTEWANLYEYKNYNFWEIILQLGWGKPEEASYKRGWPTSGSEYIHAVNPGKRPIC
ncbi:MAG: hypothetical protein F6J94_11615 [Moorea sp. SIO1F2]|uniref:hypothetical protein n=1 Tax=Moorena sp. SIO1F2 TaxID=2607819 RepID=UPI0013BBC089|nr:hypothetical protein [Moorena sp. SIO1F2]NET82552.1 hypothetical protein [Moorena sp. SIO1F2]